MMNLGQLYVNGLKLGDSNVNRAYIGTQLVHYSPLELGASLLSWYDASDESTVSLNGSTVSQLDDKSGNGNHLTQPTASSQPTYQSNILNNKNILRFLNDTLILPSGLYGLPNINSTMYIIAKQSPLDGFTRRLITLNSSGDPRYTIQYLGVTSQIGFYNGNVSIGNQVFVSASLDSYNVICTKRDGVNQYLGLNGGALSTNNLATSSIDTNGGVLGANASGSGGFSFNGDVAEIVIINRITTSEEDTNLLNYLKSKWGL